MRHITQKELEESIAKYESKLKGNGKLSDDDNFMDVWQAKANKALEEVAKYPDEEKSVRVNAHSAVWADVKDILLDVSDQKCWYCESQQVRSDNNVDHFRPKNQVIECPDHLGYWWLAFDFTNYRLSCTFCNSNRKDKQNKTSGGKHDHFPLVDETKRAYSNSCSDETPMLLDPMIKSDAGLIWFLPDGTAIPKWNENINSTQYQRADCSIKLYHLNHTNLVELRRELCNYIRRLVEDGNVHFAKYINGDQSAWYSYNRVFEELALTIDKSVEYSKAAKSVLIEYSKKYVWLESVIAD